MAQSVQPIEKAPAFDARTYSDRLQETRQAEGALPPAQVFDKEKPASIVGMMDWLRASVYTRIQALIEFTADHELRLNTQSARLTSAEEAIAELKAQRVPFGSRSG